MRRLYFTCWIVCGLILGACEKVPKEYQLSETQMTNILADIHISESATQHLSLSLRDSMVELYLAQILEIHQVEMDIFKPEYERLKKDPERLQRIYAKIIVRLNDLKKKKAKEKNEETKKK
ncbi:MAG: DUF4296 domain-containing protein [Bacteroidota bacterium]